MPLNLAHLKQLCTLKSWLLVFMIACADTGFAQPGEPPSQEVDSFPLNTGDITYDAALDDPAFVVCNPKVVFQYYNTASYYKQHKREIERYFKSHYLPTQQTASETGYITIRFIINCSGRTGRFRMYELNADYQPYKFADGIRNQLLQLTKELKGWQPAVYKNTIYDSYQYITFKLNKGAIECVLP